MDRRAAGALLALAACIACTTAAPMASSNHTALDVYDGASEGCYYNFQHYGEGDRIMTNEPCLNCTCHNRMLMCYLRVCPFTKPIGQDCTVEKRADQCCPIVTCPDVPVDLLTSTSTSSPAEYGATGIGKQDKYGCSINGRYFPEGSKVPPSPNKPCEHCYCIRNMTTCVMQECTLHVDGCVPIYHKDVCCPVRYSCDHPEDEIPLLDDMTTTVRPTPGFLLTTTTLTPVTQASQDCVHDDQIFADGALIKTEKACEHCYCMKGDIVCVVQECGTPMENEGKNCTSLPPRHGQCCPDTYICEGDELVTDQFPEVTTAAIVASTNPPRKSVEGSGYRKETDESYTDMPIFDTTEPEGSGEDQPTLSVEPETLTPEKPSPDLEDEMFLTTAKESELKPHSSTAEPSLDETKVPSSEASAEQSSPEYEPEISTESTKPDVEEEDESLKKKEDDGAPDKDVEITGDIKETQKPLMTTITDDGYDVSSSSEGLTSREDQSVITTESSFRKEDFIPAVTDRTSQAVPNEVTFEDTFKEVTTQDSFKEATTQDTFRETTTRGILTEVVTQGVLNKATTEVPSKYVTENELFENKVTEEEHKELVTLSEETATSGTKTYVDDALVTTESSGKGDVTHDEKEITNIYGSASTHKSELSETTTLNPIENEIDEDSHESSGRIPGEGDCLLNGITYKNYTTVPSINKCHTQCRCISSIVKCDPIICSPPPEYANMNKCQPIYDSAESCCPTYICDQSKETILPESHSQMSGTESTRPIHDSDCKGDECKFIKEEEKIVPIQTVPGVPDCGTEGCAADIGSSTAQTEECDNGKCDQSLNKDLPCDASTGCQVSPVKPCEGDDCTAHHDINETADEASVIEKECDSDSCRRKETAQDAQEPSTICNGDQCDYPTEADKETKELTTQAPYIPDASTKIIEKDDSATASPDYSIIKPDQELTSPLEQQTPYETSSTRIESATEEHTTKYEEYQPESTDASVIPGAELLTSKQPIDEVDVNEISTEHGPPKEIDTTVLATVKEKEYLTTTSHSLLTEPTLAEENTEPQKTEEEITVDEKKFTTESSISGLDAHEPTIAEADKFTTPNVAITSSQQNYTLQDNEKETVTLDINTKTPVKDDDKDLTETGATESTIAEDITDKEIVEKDLTTLAPSSQDSEHATEAHISKLEDTTSNTMEEIVTKFEEAPGAEENLTEGVIDNIYTTQRNLETTKQHEVPTDGGSVDKFTDLTKTPLSSTDRTESISTESSILNAMEEKITQQMSDDSVHGHEIVTTEAVPSDTEQYKTTKLPDSDISEDVLGTKEPEQEELLTNVPVTLGDKTSHTTDLIDQMESLNGRATESPKEDVETDSSAETDMFYTTSDGIEKEVDKTQTELAGPSTENTFDASQKTTIEDVVTKMPSKVEEEVTKFDTDTQMLTTEPSRRAEVASEVSQAIDLDDENVISTDTIKEFTTELPSSSDLHAGDKDTIEENKEPQEVTQKSEPHISTAAVTDVDAVTEPSIDIQKVSTSDINIPEKEEHATSEGHEIEISTLKVIPNIESVTETVFEDLSDVTKKPEEEKTSEDDHLKISTEPTDVFTTSQEDVSLSRTTLLPETSDYVLETSTTKHDKDTETGSYEVDQTQELDKAITQMIDVTTSAVVTSEIDVKPKPTVASHIIEEVYPHDITTETNLIAEKETINKATTVPQTVTEEELVTGYPEKEAAVTSQGLDIDDNRQTTEIQTSKEHQYTTSHSITSGALEKETHSDKLDLATTETAEAFTEKDISSTQLKDKSSEVPDFITPTSQMEVTEVMNYVQETSKTTYRPDLGTPQDITTEKEELTETPVHHVSVDENSTKIKDIVPTEESITELIEPSEITKDDKEGELEDKLTTVQIAEDLIPDKELMTESPDISVKVTADAVANDLVTKDLVDDTQGKTTTPILVTESAKITTEASNFEEEAKFTTVPEPGVHEDLLEDKDEITESSIHKVTDIPITSSQETITETVPEFIDTEDHDKTMVDEKEQTEDLSTTSPEVVTEIIEENVDNSRKTTDLPKVIDTSTSKITDILEEVTKLLDEETQEEATGKPALGTSILDKESDKETTIPSEVYVSVETTSQLPEDEAIKKDVASTTEKYFEHSTDIFEHSSNKPAETEDENLATETNEISPTVHDGLAVSDISANTESVAMAAVDKKHDNEISQDEKLTSETPISSTQTNEDDLLKDSSPKGEQEDVTQVTLDSAVGSETYTKAESTTEKELFDSNKVHKDEEAITSSYTGEQYTQLPEKALTDLPKASTEASDSVTKEEMEKTEISVTPIQETNEEKVSTDVPQSFTTQRPETETEMSVTLSSETPTLVPEVGHMIGDQIKEIEVPESDTELPTSMSHIAQKETSDKESFSTETPVSITSTSDEYSGVTHKILHETTSQPKETDYIATEKVDLPTQVDLEGSIDTTKEPGRLDTKPLDETTKATEYETSRPTDEFSETTPYFIELEEHTHKSIEQITPEVHQEYESSTITLESQHVDKEEYDVTTENKAVYDLGQQTEDTPKQSETSGDEEKQGSTISSSQDDLDKFHTTEIPQEQSTEHSIAYEKHTTPQATHIDSETEVTEDVATSHDKETSTPGSIVTTLTYEKQEPPKQEEQTVSVTDVEKEIALATDKPLEAVSPVRETTAPEEEFLPAVTKGTTKIAEEITTLPPTHFDNFTSPQDKPTETGSSTSPSELPKPGFNDVLPTDDIPSTDTDSHFPPTGSSGYGQEPDYGDEEQILEPGTCRYGGKTYLSAQQIPRDDPCDFCFCFRSDIICLQQSCPPPIHGCHEEPIQGFCCPRYECPVSMATTLNITTTTTTTTTTLPPHFLPHAYKGAAQRRGCQIKGHSYKVGEVVRASSGPCLHCTCGGDGQMKCDPKACTPEPMLRHMIAAAVSAKRRR